MRKNIRLAAIALPLIFSACNKDATTTLTPEIPEVQAHYVFKSIRFSAAGSSERATVESFPRTDFIFSNRTSVAQTAVLATEQKSSSAFTFGHALDTLLQKLDTVFLQVPVSFGSNGQVSLGTQRWPLVNNYTVRPIDKEPTRVSVAPFEKLTVSGKITQKVLKADFMVMLQDQNSQKQKQITGSWTGTVPMGEDFDFQVEDLK